jgi:integrase
MNRRDLSDRVIRSIKATGGRELEVSDRAFSHGKGSLVLRVSPAGTKSFAFKYRSPRNGRLVRKTLGAYPAVSLEEARKEALALSSQIAQGKDPRPEAEAPVFTFGELARLYIEREIPSKRSGEQDLAIIERDLLPRWGTRAADSIARSELAELLDEIQDRASERWAGRYNGGRMADRTSTLVSRMYTWGVNDRGLLGVNPFAQFKKRIKGTPAREKYLSEAEVRSLCLALAQEGTTMARAWLLMLLTLGRQQEVLRMRRKDLWIEDSSLEFGWWRIPADHAKSKRERAVFLAPITIKILTPLLESGSESIFASPRVDGPISSVQSARLRYRELTGIADPGTHILRKTGSTLLQSLGFSDEVVDACLGVAPRTVGKRHYQFWNYRPEKERAFLALADHLDSLCPEMRESLGRDLR